MLIRREPRAVGAKVRDRDGLVWSMIHPADSGTAHRWQRELDDGRLLVASWDQINPTVHALDLTDLPQAPGERTISVLVDPVTDPVVEVAIGPGEDVPGAAVELTPAETCRLILQLTHALWEIETLQDEDEDDQ